jgi:hypothetical protein
MHRRVITTLREQLCEAQVTGTNLTDRILDHLSDIFDELTEMRNYDSDLANKIELVRATGAGTRNGLNIWNRETNERFKKLEDKNEEEMIHHDRWNNEQDLRIYYLERKVRQLSGIMIIGGVIFGALAIFF